MYDEVAEVRERLERVEELLQSFVFQREKSGGIILKVSELWIVNQAGQRRVHLAESANLKGGNIRLYDRGGNIQIGLGADNDSGGVVAVYSPDGGVKARMDVDQHGNGEMEVCGPDGMAFVGVSHYSKSGIVSFYGPRKEGW
ncbi:hypothetical protein LLH00_03770 [bacterium]|nr:hypothetical protein [bacterium]